MMGVQKRVQPCYDASEYVSPPIVSRTQEDAEDKQGEDGTPAVVVGGGDGEVLEGEIVEDREDGARSSAS